LTKFTHRILLVILRRRIPGTSKQRRRTKQLSKEFVRRWLIENGFQGLEGQQIPNMTDEYIETVSERYIELYENILGEKL
jgi:phosphoribosylaminoimidazole-succinocarboxamide synthase